MMRAAAGLVLLLTLSTAAGLHRAVWDLRWEGARRLDDAKVDLGDPTVGPLATPGTYRLRLTAGGQTEETVVSVLPDPRARTSAAELSEQLTFGLDVRSRIDRVVADVGELRAIQAQAADLEKRLAGNGRAADLVALARRVTAAAAALEARFHNPKAEVVYDILAQRGGTQLHSNLTFLYVSATWGDGAPTQGMREVAAELATKQSALEAQLAELKGGDLAELEREAQALHLPRVLLKQSIEAEELE